LKVINTHKIYLDLSVNSWYSLMNIQLRVQGGFCNRLRAIVSACLWCEDIGAGLIIHWPEEPGHMACRIEEVLDTNTIPSLISFKEGYLAKARQIHSHKDMESLVQEKEILIESYSIFHNDLLHKSERALRMLRNIQIVIPLTEYPVKEGMVGVHIRRTDHAKCIAASPLDSFEDCVKGFVDSGATVYLATDEMAVKKSFVEKYGVVSPIDVLGRRTKAQQIYGIMEWMLLQKCSCIYASAGSSFSELAAWRAGIPLHWV
jgi:hypothetical protein